MKITITTILFLVCISSVKSQNLAVIADSIRKAYRIPEIGYAIVSSDSIYEVRTLGYKRHNSSIAAEPGDKFHIGSLTKGVTSFIAARLVKKNRIKWNKKFFDLYPQLKAESNKAYYNITLQELLSFRTQLPAYTITDSFPPEAIFKGSNQIQRLQFAKTFLKREPVQKQAEPSFCNAGYIAAALMLEKASDQTWEQLVYAVGKESNIHFSFGYPNEADSLQPWGHGEDLIPIPPRKDYRLTLLSAAGGINMTVNDYAKFVQVQLRGLRGKSSLLTASEFEFMHFGAKKFALGWYWQVNERNHKVSFHTGTAGSFTSVVFLNKQNNTGIVVFSNHKPSTFFEYVYVLKEFIEKKYGG